MATLTIRRLDDGVYARLRKRARDNNRSVEDEVRHILEECTQTLAALVRDLTAFHKEMAGKHGRLPDSTTLIRETRDGE